MHPRTSELLGYLDTQQAQLRSLPAPTLNE
jgi:hypothetical protein